MQSWAGRKVPPVVTHEGKRALEVTYAAGRIHGGATNCECALRPAGAFPADAVRVAYAIWLDDSFPLEPTASHAVGGKLGGLFIGSGDADGGRYSTTGASFRLTFDDHGAAVAYFYPQVRRDYVGRNPPWSVLDQSPEVRAHAVVATGVHLFRDGQRLRLRKRQWNTVELACRLNTPGKYDGLLQLTVNGATRSLSTVRYRYDAARVTSFRLGTFFGGSTSNYAPARPTKAWFADFRVTAAGQRAADDRRHDADDGDSADA